MVRPALRDIKSPLALATLGAFFVPEPLGACLILAAAIWWLCRKPFRGVGFDLLPEASDWRIDFYRFRAGQNAAVLLFLPDSAPIIVRDKAAIGLPARPAPAYALPPRRLKPSPAAALASDQHAIAR